MSAVQLRRVQRLMFNCLALCCVAAALLPFLNANLRPGLAANGNAVATTTEWPQFLGPHRTGISTETGLLTAWPTGGVKTVWQAKGGEGMSGLVVVGGQVLTLVQKDGQQWVLALDAQTGKTRWETPVAKAYENSMGDGPRATPTVHNGHVFVFTGQGILAALRATDGTIVWSQNVVADLDGKVADYGMACSPLVSGDLVIVTAGAPQATVIAVQQATGELAWKAGTRDAAGYSSPALLDVGGRAHVVVFEGNAALGLEPTTGKQLWRYAYETDYQCNIATPLAIDGKVFLSSGENHGCVLLSLEPNGETFNPVEVWSAQGTGSVLRNEWQTSILLDGYLYGFDNVGSAGPVTHLTCVDAATGKRVWQKRRFGKGNLIAADGKLFCTTMQGELVVVRATPEGYEEIGRQKLLGSTRQAPALSNGLLYLRDGREIVCVDVRAN